MRKSVLSLKGRLGVAAAVVAWLMFANISPAGAAAAPASPSAAPSMAIIDGRVTAKFVDVPLKKVLEIAARESGARVLFYGTVAGNVNVDLNDEPLEDALRQIFQGRNAAYFYTSRLAGVGTSPWLELTEIHVFTKADEASKPSIFDSLARPSAAIRASRAMEEHIGTAGKHSVDAELLSQLAQSRDVQARKTAADNLGKSWSEDAVEPLGDALAGDPSAAVREAAAQALGKTWSESAVQPLIDALAYESDALVREQAARGLAQTAGEEAINALVFALMGDRRWYVRDAAADALGTIGGRHANEALARAAATDPDGWVRETAASYAVNRLK